MIRSIVFNYLGMIVGGLVGFLLTPLLIHGLGDYYYGMWILVASIVDYYGVADIGIRFTLQRHVARWKGIGERQALNRTFATALSISLVVSVVILLMSASLMRWVPTVFHVAGGNRVLFGRVLFLLAISFAVALPGKVLGAYLCGLQRFDLYNMIGSGTTVLQAILILWALHSGYGIQGCATITLITALLSLVLCWKAVYIADPQVSLDLRSTTWAEALELLSFGFYVFVNQVGDLFRFRLDSLVIGHWLDISLVTHFNVAARLVEYFRYVHSAIIGPLISEMSALDGQAKEKRVQGLFLRSTRMTALLSLFLGALICLNGRAILSFWVGNAYVSSYVVLVTLIVGRVVQTMQLPSMVLLLARGKHKALGWWTLCEGVVNLALSIHWAKSYGILGVALGTAVPMLLFRLIVQPWYTLWVGKISALLYFVESIARPLAVLAVFLAFVWVGGFTPGRPSILAFLSRVFVQAALYGAITYLIGVTGIERQELHGLFRTHVFGRQAVPAA